MSILKEEYDKYIGYFNANKAKITGDSPNEISEAMANLQGICFRVGQVIADLEVQALYAYREIRKDVKTDAEAKKLAQLQIYEEYTISQLHFENLHKDLDKLVQVLKKRLAVLSAEMYA